MVDTSPSDASTPGDGLVTSARFLRFLLCGGAGFLVDAIILTWLMKGFDFNIYTGRAISFSFAVTTTWLLNRRFSFADLASRNLGGEYYRYFVVQIAGAVINLGVFVALISAIPGLRAIPVVPLAGGAAIALLFNFGASRALVFRANTD